MVEGPVSASPAISTVPAWEQALRERITRHPAASHILFDRLPSARAMSADQAIALLRNYDAHASVLRRLLLQAATIMPERAVGYVLENVRNEYGNGHPELRHQLQLVDLALRSGSTLPVFLRTRIRPGVKRYIKAVVPVYYPIKAPWPDGLYRPAIAAGGITATEILAVQEFACLQKAFARQGLQHHIWFNHVTVESEHSDQSLALAGCFVENYDALDAVLFGLDRVLDASVDLYDGLLESLDCA